MALRELRTVHFRPDGTGDFRRCRWRDEAVGLAVTNPGRLKDVKSFARLWNRIVVEE